MEMRWTWKEGLQFALAGQFLPKNDALLSYKKNKLEKFGFYCLKPLYRFIGLVSNRMHRPLIIILFTLLVALSAVMFFYNIPAFHILGKMFPSAFVRFLFFFYIEMNLLGMGCRALGRFNNPALIDLWKKDQLVPVFPGDTPA